MEAYMQQLIEFNKRITQRSRWICLLLEDTFMKVNKRGMHYEKKRNRR